MTTSIESFIPEIDIHGEEPADITTMETLIQIKRCTHVRDSRGRIWRMFTSLNAKSVPLNDASAPPSKTRLPWAQVDAFGRLA